MPRWSLNPNSATTHPVIVEPILAPKMIPSDSGKVINPAPTNPTAITVVALEDCSIAVVTAPVAAPVAGLRVKRIKAFLIVSPAKERSPSVMTIMPSRKIPNPPEALMIVIINVLSIDYPCQQEKLPISVRRNSPPYAPVYQLFHNQTREPLYQALD